MSCSIRFINGFQLSFDDERQENADLQVRAPASSKQRGTSEKLD